MSFIDPILSPPMWEPMLPNIDPDEWEDDDD